jgi:hypothetical protein
MCQGVSDGGGENLMQMKEKRMSRKEIYTPKPQPEIETTPFDNAEEAWFWFILAQEARSEGARITAGAAMMPRPCEPADILKCMDGLYRNRRLLMDHLLVLRHYGKRQMAPDPRRIKEVRAFALWKEALERMEPVLVRKGIVRTKLTLPQPGKYWFHAATIYEGGRL